jgi:hypothetical protein
MLDIENQKEGKYELIFVTNRKPKGLYFYYEYNYYEYNKILQ